jgi:transposase
LALAEYGIPVQHIKHHLNMSVNTIQRLRKTARERGFDPAVSPQLKLEYVEDAPRSGRPSKLTPQMEDAIVAAFTGEGKEADQKVKTARVAEEMGISATTVLRVLTSKGFGWERKKGNPYDGSWKVVPKKRTAGKEKAKKPETAAKHAPVNPVDPSRNPPIAPELDLLAMNAVGAPGPAPNAPNFNGHPHPDRRPEI